MIKTLKENRILLLFFLAGMAAALILCGIRIVMEMSNNQATALMSISDIELLAGEYGVSSEDYTAQLESAGIRPIPGRELQSSPPSLFLDGESGDYDEVCKEHGSVVGLIEDKYQISFNPIEGFEPDGTAPMVKVFYLLPSFAKRYATLGYEGSQEVENILYRALIDRSIRVLWISPFIHSETGHVISDPAEYKIVMDNLTLRSRPHGISLGEGFSVLPSDYSPAGPFVILTFWGIAAGAVLLLNCITKLSRRLNAILAGLAAIASVGAYFAVPELAVYGACLAACIIYPCLGMSYLSEKLPQKPDPGFSAASLIRSYALILISAAAFSVAGGVFIGALQSSTEYLLSIINFRGVKLSQIAPIVFAIFSIFRGLYGGSGIKRAARQILSGSKILLIMILIVLAFAIVYFVLRTGDGMVSISIAEQRFRNLLEGSFPARPRTAEFVVAWPCLAAAIVLIARGHKSVAWPFAILVSAGLASVANTFCHSRSSLVLSLERTAIGLALGAVIGIILILLLSRLIKNKSSEIKGESLT